MKVETKTLNIWNKRLDHVPIHIVAKETGLTPQTIYNALKGRCWLSTMIKINEFLIANKDKTLTKSDNLY